MHVTFNTNDVTVYLAGAGSGKTTALMNELQVMLQEYRPDEVAFTTFTRAGVATGVDRALKLNPKLKEGDLPYFQTLHRMCFRESGLKRKNILEPNDIMQFNKLLGFKVQFAAGFNMRTEDTKMLQRYDAMRSGAKSGIFVHDLYDEDRYFRLTAAYEKFKQENNLVDFYDCLIKYLEVGKPLPIQALMLDECQDLTPLQWKVVMLAASNARAIRVCGDTAQALYTYSGATPETLIALAKKYKTVDLSKTYRLPRRICALADSIVALMQEKIERTHIANKDIDGTITEIADRTLLIRIMRKDYLTYPDAIKRWFLLFRCNHHIAEVTDMLEQALIPYHTASGFCLDIVVLKRIKRFMSYRVDGFGGSEAKERFMKKYGVLDIDAPFTESQIVPSERRFVYADYIDTFGIEALMSMAVGSPWCMVATTYKVKGDEAEKVAVFLDATKEVSKNCLVSLDSELRVLYVACTRTMTNLYVVAAKATHNLHSIWEAVYNETKFVPKGRRK